MTNKESKHTATPWVVCKIDNDLYIDDKNGDAIFHHHGINDFDVDFTINCVNNHHALQKENAELRNALMNIIDNSLNATILDIAHSALTKGQNNGE